MEGVICVGGRVDRELVVEAGGGGCVRADPRRQPHQIRQALTMTAERQSRPGRVSTYRHPNRHHRRSPNQALV